MPETSDTTSQTLFLEKLQAHADLVLNRSSSNTRYAEQVLLRKEQVAELFIGRLGVVESVVSTWIDDFRPIAQGLFGVEAVDGDALLLPTRFGDYSPTLITGIHARVRKISLDEIMGPMLSLDLTSS